MYNSGPNILTIKQINYEKAGVLTEIRKREFYEKPTSVRKRKAAAAVKRVHKRTNRTATGRRIKLY